MQKITTFLWFESQAEEAAKFYVSLFKKSKIVHVAHFEDAVTKTKTATAVTFRLAGQTFMAMNGGSTHQFNPSVSLFVRCKNQKEIDTFWEALTRDGGAPTRCGWLKDKYGLSWQIIPQGLEKLIQDPGSLQAMMGMDKLDIAQIEAAATAPAKKSDKADKSAKKTDKSGKKKQKNKGEAESSDAA